MRPYTVLAFSFLLASAFQLALAGGSEPDPGEVAISLKKTIHFELVKGDVGALSAVPVDKVTPGRPAITVTFTNEDGLRILEVQNGYDKTLQYKARICIVKRKLCAPTSVIPVQAGLKGFEQWPDPIDRIVLSDFALE
jgi:hypothetical protein